MVNGRNPALPTWIWYWSDKARSVQQRVRVTASHDPATAFGDSPTRSTCTCGHRSGVV